MRILLLSGFYPPKTKGGGEISTHLIAQGLVALGHEVLVLTAGNRREEYEYQGIRVLRLPVALTAKPLLERSHSRKIARMFGRELGPSTSSGRVHEYDIIHAHDFRSALALSELGPTFAKSYGGSSPLLAATARDYAQICGTTNAILLDGSICTCSLQDILKTQRVREASLQRKPFRIWQYKYNINYRKQAFRKIPAQIFISHAQQQEIAKQQDLSEIQTAVMYNPVPAEYLSRPPVFKQNGSLLYVGTVEWYKGVGLLLEAFKSIAAEFPHAQLQIVGEGTQRAEYERTVSRWGLQYRVVFSGRIAWERLTRVYDDASVVVAPHIWIEPFGRTVVEAMARAKIVVTADAGGPAEIIQHEKTGFLFKRNSRDALAEQVRQALRLRDLPRRAMGNAARAWVLQHLTQDSIARQHEKFYEVVRSKR